MVTLEWLPVHEERKKWRIGPPLPPGAPIKAGKEVMLRAWGYPQGDHPDEFFVYRLPSPIVEWALSRVRRPTRWGGGTRIVREVRLDGFPFVVFESYDTIVLMPAGVFHTHRWQFSDNFGNQSPLVRATHVGSISTAAKVGAKESHTGAGATVTFKGTITVAMDPSLLIQLLLPWPQHVLPQPMDMIRDELAAMRTELAQFGVSEAEFSEGEILDELEGIFRHPPELEVEWEPQQLELEEGQAAEVEARISVIGPHPFPLAFAAFTPEGDLVASSDVIVVWRDENGMPDVAFTEGWPVQTAQVSTPT